MRHNGEGRALQAAHAAISSPLLDCSIEGAKGILINITGGPDLTLSEVNEAAQTIQNLADEDANIIFGTVIIPNPSPEVKITLIATGLQSGNRPVRAKPTFTSPVPPPPPGFTPPGQPRFDRPDDLDVPSFLRRRR